MNSLKKRDRKINTLNKIKKIVNDLCQRERERAKEIYKTQTERGTERVG